MAGVEGGGQLLDVAGFGVAPAFAASLTAWNALVIPSTGAALPGAASRFSFSASRSFRVSTVGAPSMNWKALSLVRVWVDGMMGGPVTTRLAGGAALLLWWGKGGALRGRHWPLNCCCGWCLEM